MNTLVGSRILKLIHNSIVLALMLDSSYMCFVFLGCCGLLMSLGSVCWLMLDFRFGRFFAFLVPTQNFLVIGNFFHKKKNSLQLLICAHVCVSIFYVYHDRKMNGTFLMLKVDLQLLDEQVFVIKVEMQHNSFWIFNFFHLFIHTCTMDPLNDIILQVQLCSFLYQ